MKKMFVTLAIASLSVLSVIRAATITENFTNNPAQDGWQIFGDTNLFQWDSASQNFDVTWSSTNQTSYFYHPLGTILTRNDNFSVAFDLQLNEVETTGYSIEMAVGFLNFSNATQPNYERAIGEDPDFGPVNVAEFDYFPGPAGDETISPTMISSNNQFASAFDFPLELTNGVLFHVAMTYTADNQTLSTAITCNNGQPFAPIDNVQLDSNGADFSDFRLDTIAIDNYSDAGDPYGDETFVQGTIKNLVVTVPPPPIQGLTGCFTNSIWQVQFISQTNWIYTLQYSTNLQTWNCVSNAISISGSGTNLFLQDTNAPTDKSFYRVRADLP